MSHVKKYDVVAICAPCIELNMQVDDEHIDYHGFKKGLTNPVDEKKLAALIKGVKGLTKAPGGPGANVATGIALRGGTSALIGKIANDEHGAFLTTRLRSNGVYYAPALSLGTADITTCVMVLTTPDKERTFAFTGSSAYNITPEDIDAAQTETALISQARIAYFDSYLWLSESGKKTVHHAAAVAKKSGSKIALALNDADIVAQNRVDFLVLATTHADILLGDRKEFMSLFGTSTLNETVAAVIASGCIAAITDAAHGVHIIENEKSTHIAAKKVSYIVDTCGAGDQFAAGFLYGLVQGKSAVESGSIGTAWAAEVLQHIGAEPKVGKNAPQLSLFPQKDLPLADEAYLQEGCGGRA